MSYAVIFTSLRTEGHDKEYARMAEKMDELAAEQPGYIDQETVRDASGFGVSVSYWKTLGDLKAWKANAEHLLAQQLGRDRWYRWYKVRVCKVEREYGFELQG